MKRVAWFSAIVLATLTAVLLLWQFRAVLGLFVLSLVVTATIRPAIDSLVERRVPTGLAMLVAYVIGIASVVALLVAISQPLVGELQRLVNDFTTTYDQIKATWPKGNIIQQMIAGQIPATDTLLQLMAGTQGAALAQTILGVTLSLVDLVSQAVLVLVLSLYWSADRVRFERLWLSLLPAEQRIRARSIWGSVETGVGAYIRSELVQSLIAVLVLSVGYTLIGMRYPALVALIVAIMWLVPLVGGLFAFAVVLAAGLISGPFAAVASVTLTVALLAILEIKVEPSLFDRKSYNAILVLVVMIAMTDAFGLAGLIVAPPLAVAIQICIAELTSSVAPIVAGTSSAVSHPLSAQVTPQVEQIRDRLATVHRMLEQMDEPSPRLVNMAERLEGLVKQLDPIVEHEQAEGIQNPRPSQVESKRSESI